MTIYKIEKNNLINSNYFLMPMTEFESYVDHNLNNFEGESKCILYHNYYIKIMMKKRKTKSV